jgi:lipopolysaccharide/colanic/teichoic acid biosynthesis glycosyltransferase
MTPAKRLFDLLFASLLALVLAPVVLVLMAVLLATSGRPLFYVAERMRAPGQPFRLWKFRTMSVAGPGEAGVSGGDKAGRVTAAGRVLRRFRADEIPQLWNVLRGDMSLVGPRPPLREYVERFPDLYAEVLECRPGVTGLATLRFHAHEDRLLSRCATAEETDAVYCRRCVPRKAQLDLIYREHRSFCFDMAIMAETLRRLARRKQRGRS